MRGWWLAIALCACGDVNKNTDSTPDAYTPDAPAELTCTGEEMVCNGDCVDLKSSDLHCGSCNNQCSPLQGCLNGSCVDKASRCTSIRLWDPQAPDGVYDNPNTGNAMYCDFTNNVTYDDFRFYRFDITPSGYTLARASDFANPQFAKAFIAVYNHTKGIRAYGSWSYNNCCVSTISGQRLKLGPSNTFVGQTPGTGGCVFSMTANLPYLMNIAGAIHTDQLPDNFFMLNPPSEGPGCTEELNPAIFYKRRFTLN